MAFIVVLNDGETPSIPFERFALTAPRLVTEHYEFRR